MSRRSAGLQSRVVQSVVALIVSAAVVAAQDWRGPAVTSFDEAWQTINDTFYDPSFGGLDWNAVKRELRPRAESADSPEAVRAVIRDMIGRLDRSHFGLMSASSAVEALPGSATVPIEIRIAAASLVITRVTPDSAADRAGLRAGQIIVSIDGHRAAAWMDAAVGRDARSRDLDAWRRAFRLLHGAQDSIATLRVKNGGGPEREVRIARTVGPGETVQLGNLPPLQVVVDVRPARTPARREVGVIGFNIWMTAVDAPIAAAIDRFRQAAGLVIDLRGNPGGLALMMNGLAGHLIAEPVLLGTMQMRETALEFKVNPRLATADGRRVTPFAGPVAILVDELTASASETLAGALQSLGRARVFGRQTMGQALPALTKKLTNGDVLMYVMGDFVTATGRRLEGVGVIPDEAVPLSIAALARGRDEPLDRALRWIDRQVQSGFRLPITRQASPIAHVHCRLPWRCHYPIASRRSQAEAGFAFLLGLLLCSSDLQDRTSFRVWVVSDPWNERA